MLWSHLTRGAWIEITISVCVNIVFGGRTSHEVRGLKYDSYATSPSQAGRTSHEVRGLKSDGWWQAGIDAWSHLTRGAWIEILILLSILRYSFVAPHTRCVD